MKIKLNKWYKFKSGDVGEFIKPINIDGMYNVFRMGENHGFRAIYTNKEFKTGYGDYIESEVEGEFA